MREEITVTNTDDRLDANDEYQTLDKPHCCVTSADIDKAEHPGQWKGVKEGVERKQEQEQEQAREPEIKTDDDVKLETAAPGRAPASIGTGGFGKVEQHSGLYSYSVPIHTPPPQNGGPVPEITLTYYSRATSGSSPVAAGWSLELGCIQRKAPAGKRVNFKNDQGQQDSNDFFVLQLNGNSYTLVRVKGQENKHRFYAKKEGAFIDVERFLKPDCIDPKSKEPEIDYWKVYTANGVTYCFGVQGAAGEKQVPGQLRNKVWHLCWIEDAYGKKAVYEYELKKSTHPEEMSYSYPKCIKYGMTRDGSSRDTEVTFVYRGNDAPNPEGIYYDLEEMEHYTGRDLFCFLRQRLTEVHTSVRDKNGQMTLTRKLVINASICQHGVFRVHTIHEEAYKGNKHDIGALLPPHRFTYIDEGASHPALMKTAREPLGKIVEMSYARAVEIDQGKPVAVKGMWLVNRALERMVDETWKSDYSFWDGTYYTPYDEYRGHSRVDSWDRETNMHTSTWYEQNGVHNGFVKKEITYDTRGDKKISQRDNQWMALDYKGGRHLPFNQKSVEYRYAEDGDTVLSTVKKEIPKVNHERKANPWEYAVDEFGNVLQQIETVYEGDLNGRIVLQKNTETAYKNIAGGAHRFIGLPIETRVYSRNLPSEAWQLNEWVKNTYNDKGQVNETITYYSAVDRAGFYKTTLEYHPVTGKETKKYRYNGTEKLLVEETRYYEKGPYRYLPHRVLNALNQVTEYKEYDLSVREPIYEIGMDGMVIQKAFDGLGRVTEEIFCGHGKSIKGRGDKDSVRYVYTVTDMERSIETIHIHTGSRAKEYFDSLSRKFKTESTGYNGRLVVAGHTKYDHATRSPYCVFEPYYDNEYPQGSTVFEYNDYRLRKSKEVHPGGKVLRYQYEGFKQTMFEDVYERDSSGHIGKKIHTRVVEEVSKDAAGRVAKRADSQAGDPLRYELNYQYDSRGRPVKVTDNQGVTLSLIDYGDRIDDKPASTVDVSSGKTTWVYDGLGRVIEARSDFKGKGDRITTTGYDQLDRVVRQEHRDTAAEGTRIIESEYDTAPHGVGLLARQSLTETSRPGTYSHSVNCAYDAFGYLSSVSHDFAVKWADPGIDRSGKVKVNYVHNGPKGGRLEQVACREVEGFPGVSSEVVYGYDDVSGLVKEIRLNGKPVWQITGAGVTARGHVKGTLLGNGINSNYDYDLKSGWLKELKVMRSSDILLAHLLRYDTSGNVREKMAASILLAGDGVENPINSRGVYNYNHKNQLIQSSDNGKEQRFIYKPNGSRARFVDGTDTTRYTYEESHPHRICKLSGAHQRELSYDEAGNLVKDIDKKSGYLRQFTWNPANKLQCVEFFNAQQDRTRRICYGYGGDEQRVVMADTLEDRLVFLVGDVFAVEWMGKEKGVFHTQVLKNGRRVMSMEQDTNGNPLGQYYYHRDHLSSVIFLTDEKGRVISTTGYEAFGKVCRESGNRRSDILFTGHRADVVNYEGFIHYDFKARVYDPEIGIFISPDRVEDTNNAAFGLNRYVYVNNNPLSRLDPSGNENEASILSGWYEDNFVYPPRKGLEHVYLSFKELFRLNFAGVYEHGKKAWEEFDKAGTTLKSESYFSQDRDNDINIFMKSVTPGGRLKRLGYCEQLLGGLSGEEEIYKVLEIELDKVGKGILDLVGLYPGGKRKTRTTYREGSSVNVPSYIKKAWPAPFSYGIPSRKTSKNTGSLQSTLKDLGSLKHFGMFYFPELMDPKGEVEVPPVPSPNLDPNARPDPMFPRESLTDFIRW